MLVLLWLAACAQPSDCESLCDTLVITCDYAAFPSVDSCLDGCAYREKYGADISSERACVEKADCNTFDVLECENRFGTGSQ